MFHFVFFFVVFGRNGVLLETKTLYTWFIHNEFSARKLQLRLEIRTNKLNK